jgi:putative FmdB family regulatory protein
VPTYQYACTACGHRFDAVQSFSDSSLTDCPECAGRLRKVFSSVGIVFKGSGFYRTDSRSGGANGDGEKAKTPESSPGKDSPGKDSPGKDGAASPSKESAAKTSDAGSSTSSTSSTGSGSNTSAKAAASS